MRRAPAPASAPGPARSLRLARALRPAGAAGPGGAAARDAARDAARHAALRALLLAGGAAAGRRQGRVQGRVRRLRRRARGGDEQAAPIMAPLFQMLGLWGGADGAPSPGRPLGERARSRVKSVILMLRRHAQTAQLEAQHAREERDAAIAQARDQEKEIAKVRKVVKCMTRYVEELEDDRDHARARITDLETQLGAQQAGADAAATQAEQVRRLEEEVAALQGQLREADDAKWAEVAKTVEQRFLDLGGSGPADPAAPEAALAGAEAAEPAEGRGVEPPAVADMSVKDLQWECVLRCLSPDGALPVLRSRVRIARAKDRAANGAD